VIGASKPQQVDECVACLSNLSFDAAELESIERILAAP
jgi:aryl-alcohol dehydrogenase-like predicted oxidoreductase